MLRSKPTHDPTSDDHKNLAERLVAGPLFGTVPVPQLASLLQRTRYSLNRYSKGAIIAFRGDQYDRLMVLLAGAVRTEMTSYRGKHFAVAEHNAPCPLAPAFVFGRNASLPVSIVATTESEILRLPRSAVMKLCREHETFLNAYLDEVSDRLSTLADKLRLSRLATIRERVADYLLDQSDRQGTRTLELSHSRRELSEIMGVTRPALSRVFAELADDGVILYDRGNVQILDLDALLDIVPE